MEIEMVVAVVEKKDSINPSDDDQQIRDAAAVGVSIRSGGIRMIRRDANAHLCNNFKILLKKSGHHRQIKWAQCYYWTCAIG